MKITSLLLLFLFATTIAYTQSLTKLTFQPVETAADPDKNTPGLTKQEVEKATKGNNSKNIDRIGKNETGLV